MRNIAEHARSPCEAIQKVPKTPPRKVEPPDSQGQHVTKTLSAEPSLGLWRLALSCPVLSREYLTVDSSRVLFFTEQSLAVYHVLDKRGARSLTQSKCLDASDPQRDSPRNDLVVSKAQFRQEVGLGDPNFFKI